MDVFARIAEQRIEEALRKGVFERLEFAGKPLPPEPIDGVPAELRAAYRMLRGAGCLPEEMELKREVLRLRDLLEACEDPEERGELDAELRRKRLRFEVLMERRRAR